MLSPRRGPAADWLAAWNALPSWQRYATVAVATGLCLLGVAQLISPSPDVSARTGAGSQTRDQPRSRGIWDLLGANEHGSLPSREGVLEDRIERCVGSFDGIADATARVQLRADGTGSERTAVFLLITPQSEAVLSPELISLVAEATQSALPASLPAGALRIASSRPPLMLYADGRYVGPPPSLPAPAAGLVADAPARQLALYCLAAVVAGVVLGWVLLRGLGSLRRRPDASAAAPEPREEVAPGDQPPLCDLGEEAIRAALADESPAVVHAALALAQPGGGAALHPRVVEAVVSRVREGLAGGSPDTGSTEEVA